jgi:hypothetical protein
MQAEGSGLLCFLYSVIMSRNIKRYHTLSDILMIRNIKRLSDILMIGTSRYTVSDILIIGLLICTASDI